MKAPNSSKLDGQFYLHWAAHSMIMESVETIIGEEQLTPKATLLMAHWMANGHLAPADAKDWTQVAQWLGVKNGGIATIAESLSAQLKPIVIAILSGMEKAGEPGTLPDLGGKDPVEAEIEPEDLALYCRVRDQFRYLYRLDPLRPSPTHPGTADEAKALAEFCTIARKHPEYIREIGQDLEEFEATGLSLAHRSAQIALSRAEYQLTGLWDDEDLDMLIFEEARIEAMCYLGSDDESVADKYESIREMLDSGITAIYQPGHARSGRSLYLADIEAVEAYFQHMHEASFARYQKSQRQQGAPVIATADDELKIA